MQTAQSLEKTWCWERLKAKGEEGSRGWDGWMVSLTQWTWIWANSGRRWRTRKPGMLQSMGSQRVRHDLVTEQGQKNCLSPQPRKEHGTWKWLKKYFLMGYLFTLKPWCMQPTWRGPSSTLKAAITEWNVTLCLATKPQRTIHCPPEHHLGLGRNPIKVDMTLEISPIDWLQEICLSP